MQKEPLARVRVEQEVMRIFPRSSRPTVEYVEEGVSTYVYRIRYAHEIFYLRVLPEINASFAPEVLVHQLLREKQVHVPEVLYFEHYNEAFERSIMVTTEIKGKQLGHCHAEQDQRTILREAGRELAIINSLPVEYFGWIRRDRSEVSHLIAELPSYRAFVLDHLEDDLAILDGQILKSSEIVAIRQVLTRFDRWVDDEQARLAHGDFDVTHIYQDQGRYTGIIDFGEIRGTPALYDLGHFRLRDGETLPTFVLPYLLEGYREAALLPSDYEQRIALSSLLIGIRTLANTKMKRPEVIHNRHTVQSIARDRAFLLL